MVKRRMKPLVAWRAMQRLLEDPEDTSQVFHIVRALSGSRSFERLFRRVMNDEQGRGILEDGRSLLTVLEDRERLSRLPEGSLGREYLEFMESEQLTGVGLLAASEKDSEVEIFLDDRGRRLGERLRDAHDLWHVIAGYGRDLVGETALLAFTFAHTRNLGLAFVATVGTLRLRREGYRDSFKVVGGAYRRGKRAAFFPAVDWEALLGSPMGEVRERVGVGEPPAYEPVRTADMPVLASGDL